MAYLKPPWFVSKVFNRVAMATGLSGSETLEITRRRSGDTQRIPVLTVVVDGVRATEIPVELRGPVLAAYRVKAGKTVETYFRSLPDPADHPVFALDPR